MTVVLLHGNPETPAVWDPLIGELAREDVVAPALPGFGCPTPDGWGASMDEYAGWLVAELERIVSESGPVDIVGHDWGGTLTMRAVSQRPDLFRSWACDVLGAFHERFEWHDLARMWQTPGAGEEYFSGFLGAPMADRIALYESLGIPRATAEPMLAVTDERMTECVLRLYRSAVQPAVSEWGAELGPAAGLPGLAIRAPEDAFAGDEDLSGEVAERLGASVAVLEGQGHWWMLGDPAGAAAAIEEFWRRA